MKHFKWYFDSKDVLSSALYILFLRIIKGDNYLTPDYLIDKGWVVDDDDFYYEEGVKKKFRIYIKFSDLKNGYMVYLTEEKIYLTYETKIEWFEMFYLLQHPDNGRHEIIGD